jgi:phosphate transport system permease protein
MAVILVAGNAPMIPTSLVQPIRTLTGNIAIEMGYAFGLHREALFATGVILFIFIMILNLFVNYFANKAGES